MQYFPKINGSEILISIIAHTQNKVKINLYKNGNILHFLSERKNEFLFSLEKLTDSPPKNSHLGLEKIFIL